MQYGVLTVHCNIPYNNIENKNYTIIESRVKLMANVSIRVEEMKKNPSLGKSYTDVDKMMEDLLS